MSDEVDDWEEWEPIEPGVEDEIVAAWYDSIWAKAVKHARR